MGYKLINETLDAEHKQIFDSLFQIYNLCNIPVNNKREYIFFKKNVLYAIRYAYLMAKNHWTTEQRYFNDGKRMQPYNHKDTYEDIEAHVQEHTKNLKNLKRFYDHISSLEYVSKHDSVSEIHYIKQFIINAVRGIELHINTMDDPHFSHWVKSTGYL